MECLGDYTAVESLGDYTAVGSRGDYAAVDSLGDYAAVDSRGEYAVVDCPDWRNTGHCRVPWRREHVLDRVPLRLCSAARWIPVVRGEITAVDSRGDYGLRSL